MKYKRHFSAGILLLSFILASCSWNVPSSSEDMDDKWNDVCQLAVVERLVITYSDKTQSSGGVTRKCYNTVSRLLTPNEEKKYWSQAHDIFGDICKSDQLMNASLVTKGRNIGNSRRNCSR